MKFVYIAYGKEPPATTEAFGHFFELNVPVEVTDAHAIKKLSANPHFRSVGEKTAAPKKEETVSKPAEPAKEGDDKKTEIVPVEVTLEQMKEALKAAGVRLQGLNAEKVAAKYQELQGKAA